MVKRELLAINSKPHLEQHGASEVQAVVGLVAVPAARHDPAAVLESAFLDVEVLDIVAGEWAASSPKRMRMSEPATRNSSGPSWMIAAPPTGRSLFGFGGVVIHVQSRSPNSHWPYCAVTFQRPSAWLLVGAVVGLGEADGRMLER